MIVEYRNGFPSQYVLDNILYMDEFEVKRWLNLYKEYTMRKLSQSEITQTNEEDININLVDTKGNIYVEEDSDKEFEAQQFTEEVPQEITSYFKGE